MTRKTGIDAKRILLVDDHQMLRSVLCELLGGEDDFDICGAIGTVAEALSVLKTQKLDLVITDISLPDRSGLDLIEEIETVQPGVPVLILSMHNEPEFWKQAFQSGARGYLPKEEAVSMLVPAVRQIFVGKDFIYPALAEPWLDQNGNRESNM